MEVTWSSHSYVDAGPSVHHVVVSQRVSNFDLYTLDIASRVNAADRLGETLLNLEHQAALCSRVLMRWRQVHLPLHKLVL